MFITTGIGKFYAYIKMNYCTRTNTHTHVSKYKFQYINYKIFHVYATFQTSPL